MNWKTAYENPEEFQALKSNFHGGPARTNQVWFRFDMKNNLDKDIWINVLHSNIINIEFYKISDTGELLDSTQASVYDRGLAKNFNSQTFWYNAIERNDTKNYTFLIVTRMNLVHEIPIYIGSFEQLISNENTHNYFSMFYIGALLVILLYNLFILYVTQDKIYLFYSLYLATFLVGIGYLNNYPVIAEALMGEQFTHNNVFSWISLLLISTAFFTIEYFELKKTSYKAYKGLIVLMALVVLLMIVGLFIPMASITNVYQVLAMIFYSYIFIISIRQIIAKNKKAYLFSVAWGIMLLGLMIYLGVINDLIPYTIFTRKILYVTTFLEMLIFSIALGQRINELNKMQGTLNQLLADKNKELEGINEALDSFNYHVNHDLKTVLNNALSLSKMVDKYNDKGDPVKVKEITKRLKKVAKSGSETVESFLALSKLDAMLASEETPISNLKDVIKDVIDQNELKDKITIDTTQIKYDQLRIHPKALESIILNFITNSIKYCEKYPKAVITAIKVGSEVVITYKDNGIGIDIEKNGKLLFEPFKKIKNNLKKEGSGVGLFLVKRIVNGYSGKISAKSKLGEGLEFTITFPVFA